MIAFGVLLGALTFLTGFPITARAGDIAKHPDELTFPEMEFTPPDPADYRHQLDCGATVYIAENAEVPTFDLTILVRAGSAFEPQDKAGLAEMTAYLMRNGGTADMTASEIDERLAYLAGSASVNMSPAQGRVSLFCLSKDMDEGLDILRKILTTPAFDQATLDQHKADVLSELEQRNASTSSIESREWAFLLYGDHPFTRQFRRTGESVGSITQADLKAFHETYFFPQNFTLAVAGEFKTKDVLEKLNAFLADWPHPPSEIPTLPDQIDEPEPGVYLIGKEEVNQSRVRVGHQGVKRDIPDQYALRVMNDILGGGGFTSRITRRVRSDEGLAYSTGSRFVRRVEYPGTFEAWFQTKHATVAFGTGLIVEEINRIRTETCTEETLEISRASLISGLVNPFGSKTSIVGTFASDDFTSRPDDYWKNFKRNVEAVTPGDVLEVAQKYLHPDKLIYLVVGDPEAVGQGSEKHDDKLEDFGEVTILPLRDPISLAIK